MCGILAVFSINRKGFAKKLPGTKFVKSFRDIAYEQSGKQRHRGPDHTGVEVICDKGVAMVHERLAILGVATGDQPFRSDNGNVTLVANAEIYNFKQLSEDIRKRRGEYEPKSDCNVLIELYEDYGERLLDHISGMYAFALYDKARDLILIARDPHGIIPLYRGFDENRNLWIASEMKCLVDVCKEIEIVEPGTMLFGPVDKIETKRFFQPWWYTHATANPTNLELLRESFESAVRSHLQCEVQYAALLSGGVDSSLVAAIATKIQREKQPNFKLKTFSVGLPGAPDFLYSRKVADFIKSDHTEVIFTIDQGLDCIRDVIYHLETYDIMTIRCSIPMFILTRYIKSMGIKMVLTGEGSDEIFGGYLYFHNAPTYEAFHEELVQRVRKLYLSDCLRTNKTAMAWGIELRVPFLDKDFVNIVMSIDPADKIPGHLNRFDDPEMPESVRKMEKYILRKAFDDGTYLPKDVLFRQKEQFSDGVGYSWINTLSQYTADMVSDEQMKSAAEIYPINTPTCKEAFYYRGIFEEIFPGEHCARTVKKWHPRADWGCSVDPSGRRQKEHASYE